MLSKLLIARWARSIIQYYRIHYYTCACIQYNNNMTAGHLDRRRSRWVSSRGILRQAIITIVLIIIIIIIVIWWWTGGWAPRNHLTGCPCGEGRSWSKMFGQWQQSTPCIHSHHTLQIRVQRCSDISNITIPIAYYRYALETIVWLPSTHVPEQLPLVIPYYNIRYAAGGPRK